MQTGACSAECQQLVWEPAAHAVYYVHAPAWCTQGIIMCSLELYFFHEIQYRSCQVDVHLDIPWGNRKKQFQAEVYSNANLDSFDTQALLSDLHAKAKITSFLLLYVKKELFYVCM